MSCFDYPEYLSLPWKPGHKDNICDNCGCWELMLWAEYGHYYGKPTKFYLCFVCLQIMKAAAKERYFATHQQPSLLE